MDAAPEDRKKAEKTPPPEQANGEDGDASKKKKKKQPRVKKERKEKTKKATEDKETDKSPSSEKKAEANGTEPEEKKKESKKASEADGDEDAKQPKKKRERKKREKKDNSTKQKGKAAAMSGLVTKDPVTGGPVEFSVAPLPGRVALISELFGNHSAADQDASAPKSAQFTHKEDLSMSVDNQSLEFEELPAKSVHLWPETTLEIDFDMQHVETWRQTTAYSSGKNWDVNTPIRLPAVVEQIDIPLRNMYYADEPALASATGLRSGQPTRNLVVIHSVKCMDAVSENMHTDLSMVFCALKPVTLVSRYPEGRYYGRDFTYDVQMIEKTFGNHFNRVRTPDAQKAASAATGAMTSTMASSSSSSKDVQFDVAQSTVMGLSEMPMFSSTSDKWMAFLQKKSAEESGTKRQQKGQRDDVHWDTRRPDMDFSLYVNRHFMQDVFDSPYNGVLPLPHSSDTARDHWRALPSIPIMRKPPAKSGAHPSPVVYMRTPAVGMRLPHRNSDARCRNRKMYTSEVLRNLMDLENNPSDVSKAQAKRIRDQISQTIAVDLNAEMVTAVRSFADAKQGVEAYLAEIKASMPTAPRETPNFDMTVRSRIEDYSRYRVVFDTRKDFHKFRCWMDQYAYMMWKRLVAVEASRVASVATALAPLPSSSAAPFEPVAAAAAASPPTSTTPVVTPAPTPAKADGGAATVSSAVATVASPGANDKSPQPAETRSVESAIRDRAYVQEGPFVVLSVRRDLLFEFAARVCAASQTEVVDLNTAHLTLYPHEPMDVISDRISGAAKAAHPELSVRVSVSFTHVSC